jgi:hypothetical protein
MFIISFCLGSIIGNFLSAENRRLAFKFPFCRPVDSAARGAITPRPPLARPLQKATLQVR